MIIFCSIVVLLRDIFGQKSGPDNVPFSTPPFKPLVARSYLNTPADEKYACSEKSIRLPVQNI